METKSCGTKKYTILEDNCEKLRKSFSSDNVVLGKLRGVFSENLDSHYLSDYQISNALPHLPFPWLNQAADESTKITDYIYKTTNQIAMGTRDV
ncbi:unnamed protein product, partial [Hymenolepis diminuta]